MVYADKIPVVEYLPMAYTKTVKGVVAVLESWGGWHKGRIMKKGMPQSKRTLLSGFIITFAK